MFLAVILFRQPVDFNGVIRVDSLGSKILVHEHQVSREVSDREEVSVCEARDMPLRSLPREEGFPIIPMAYYTTFGFLGLENHVQGDFSCFCGFKLGLPFLSVTGLLSLSSARTSCSLLVAALTVPKVGPISCE